MADTPEVLATTPADPAVHATVEHGAGEHLEPSAFGFTPSGWVGLAMLAFIAILLWKGVHKMLAAGLDSRIAAIREQLDEAKKLREEAEALRAEYAAKIANAEQDAAAMLDHARVEADAIVVRAESDAETVIARRKQMAEDKIAAAERAAVEELRATTANAATAAARNLIEENYQAEADRKLVDDAITAM